MKTITRVLWGTILKAIRLAPTVFRASLTFYGILSRSRAPPAPIVSGLWTSGQRGFRAISHPEGPSRARAVRDPGREGGARGPHAESAAQGRAGCRRAPLEGQGTGGVGELPAKRKGGVRPKGSREGRGYRTGGEGGGVGPPSRPFGRAPARPVFRPFGRRRHEAPTAAREPLPRAIAREADS